MKRWIAGVIGIDGPGNRPGTRRGGAEGAAGRRSRASTGRTSTPRSGCRMTSSATSTASSSTNRRSRPTAPLDGAFYKLRDMSEANIRAIIEETAVKAGDSGNAEAKKVGDLFASFMDEAKVDELGIKPIQADDLAMVESIATKADLSPRPGQARPVSGVDGAFGIGVDTDAKKSDRYIIYFSQGGTRPARRVVLPPREVQADPRRLPRPRPQDVRAGRPCPTRPGPAEQDPRPRNPARQGPLGPGQEPRRHADLQQDDARGAQGNRPPVSTGPPGSTARRSRACPKSSSASRPTSRRWPGPSTRFPLEDWKNWLAWNVIRGAAPLT